MTGGGVRPERVEIGARRVYASAGVALVLLVLILSHAVILAAGIAFGLWIGG
jgi:hypothetical protein